MDKIEELQDLLDDLENKVDDLSVVKDNAEKSKEQINYDWHNKSLPASIAKDIKRTFELLTDIYDELESEIEDLEERIEDVEEELEKLKESEINE